MNINHLVESDKSHMSFASYKWNLATVVTMLHDIRVAPIWGLWTKGRFRDFGSVTEGSGRGEEGLGRVIYQRG